MGLLFGAFALIACLAPAGADTYWHLRAGEEIWRTHHVPLDEHYSFTAVGRFWPNHEWLWQALSFGAFRLGGMPLLTATTAALAMGALAIVYRLMVGPAWTRLALMLLALPLASGGWGLRPQVVSVLLLALLLWLLVTERYRWLPPLFVLWANAHGGVAQGGLVLGAAALAAIWRARAHPRGGPERQRAITLAVLVPVCAVATALTPLGFGLWRFMLTSTALSRQDEIAEWLPAYPTSLLTIWFWLLALGLCALLVRRRRALAAAPWSDVVLLAAALVTLPLAARAVRLIPVFALLAMPAASRLLGPDVHVYRRRSAGDRPRVNLAVLVAVSLAEAAIVAVAWATALPRFNWKPISDGALAALNECPDRVYNDYNRGGFLLWFARPKPVFVDSRQDPYPAPFLAEHIAVEVGAPYQPLFTRHRIACAILSPQSRLGARLTADGWRTRFRDDAWAVLVAPGAP